MKWRFLWCAEVCKDSLVDFARCALAGEIAKVAGQKLAQKLGYALGGVFVLLDFLSCSSWEYSLFYDFVIFGLWLLLALGFSSLFTSFCLRAILIKKVVDSKG